MRRLHDDRLHTLVLPFDRPRIRMQQIHSRSRCVSSEHPLFRPARSDRKGPSQPPIMQNDKIIAFVTFDT